MRDADFILGPCSCGECVQAGVSDQDVRRDPYSGKPLHGYDLKRWYEARDRVWKQARTAVGSPGRHAKGFEKLATRQPGEDE